MKQVPVITIDGPTASGKGTVAHRVAQHLGWHVLDSGALYRLVALACLKCKIDLTNQKQVAQKALNLDFYFDQAGVWLSGREVSKQLREEAVGNAASQIAAYEPLRDALLQRQRDFLQTPGLVADGRDMGTIVFPNANLKIFLIADVRERAERRCKQLIGKGFFVNIDDVLSELKQRDKRDENRLIAPLMPAKDAVIIDSSNLTIDETVAQVLTYWFNNKT